MEAHHTDAHRKLHAFVTQQPVLSKITLSRLSLTSDVLRSIHKRAQTWRSHPPAITSHETCPVAHRQQTLRVPAKLYVLHALITTAHALCTHVCPNVSDELSTRLQAVCTAAHPPVAPTYHWFHTYAHEPMQALTTPYVLQQLRTCHHDPWLPWAASTWAQHPDLFDYFVPLDVQHAYEQQLQCTQTHTWKAPPHGSDHSTRTYTLNVLSPHSSVVREIITHLAFRITTMSQLGAHRCDKGVTLLWYPSAKNKHVGAANVVESRGIATAATAPRCCTSRVSKHARRKRTCRVAARASAHPPLVWNPFQINTGATYRHTCDTVTIWRREEACKTFLHEMMHGFGWDFGPDNDTVHDWVKQNFHVADNIEIRFYEGYVETWATLLNVYMAAAVMHPKHSLAQLFAVVKKWVACEQRWVLFQLAKVLVHSGFESWREFFGTHKQRASSDVPRFQQNTSVFSYFVVRAAHLWDVNWFVKHFPHVAHDENTTKPTLDAWLEHLRSVYADKAFEQAVNTCVMLVRGLGEKDAWVGDTMRMTCVEVI